VVAVSLGFSASGTRIRKKVSGRTKTEVRDKLRELHQRVDSGLRPRRRCTVATRSRTGWGIAWAASGASGDETKPVHAAARPSPFPNMRSLQTASPNTLTNIVLGAKTTDFVEFLLKPTAKAAADDLLHDFRGAAEAQQNLLGVRA